MRKMIKKAISLFLVAAMVVTLCPSVQPMNVQAASEDGDAYNLSYGRPVYASSQAGDGSTAEYAVDNNNTTRWQAKQSDQNEWIYVDLGKEADIDHIYLHWEAAYAKKYQIQVSNDEDNWTTIYTKGQAKGAHVNMAFTYEVTKFADGYGELNANWTAVGEGNTKYQVYDGDEIAKAPDNYSFTAHGGTQGNIKLSEGKHTLKVIALDKTTNEELGSGTCEVDVKEGGKGNNGIEVDTTANLKQTISKSDMSATKGRYVRVLTTERATGYGCSLYEFQVWGTGGASKRPADYGENLALNKKVECSGTRDEWWMYDKDGNLLPDAYKNVKPENAVDGDASTAFTSYQGDEQWITVDLGQAYTLGRVVINWNADAGKMYDVMVSADNKNWTTVHRVLKGYAFKNDNLTFYQENVRYVKVLGYTKVESGSGIGITELSVYQYNQGDSKDNETIEDLPTRQIINNANGKGSYVSGEMYNEKNKLPTFVNEDNIKTPIDSNSWWSSVMVQKFSNLLCSTPLKTNFSKKGLGVLLATSGWVGTRKETDLGTDQSTETLRDFYISPEELDGNSAYDRAENYGDYSVQIGLMDDNGLQMKSTIVKGSPYIYNEFENQTIAFLSGNSITEFFDGNGNKILENKGDTITTDHIGFVSIDEENTKAKNDGSYFELNVPKGTQFKVMIAKGNYKLKITFPSAKENYMSVAAMTKKTDIDSYYKHGYAFVTNTHVDYSYNSDNSKIITTYKATTKVMRQGFTDVTMHCMFPHQWKHSTDDEGEKTVATYPSIRGNMKSVWANTYSTTQQFSGLLPTFAKSNSSMFDSGEMIDYLNQVVASKINTTPVSDAYWEGKNVHPLAISVIMADQLGETEIKEQLLAKLKSIMVDWFNYDGGDDRCYLIYNKDWGTLYYPDSAYGANAAICDHHFTYGYFMFGAAVLAAYDKDFYNDYKDMVELLVRDYADPEEPEDDGNMFCKFRAFDQYSGHSWAGGYGDSDSGNNQESASEALFSWVGMYLWGEATQNQKYIDAGAYGFTTEMDAVEQYWFDYDEDNWLPEYPFQAAGQIYGASMGYGTYFGGQPTYVYGIQWLPISEYLTNYGMNQEKCAKIYKGLEDDTAYAINIEKNILGNITSDDEYVTPDNGWQHITWPYLSQTDPKRAYDKFENNVSKVQTEDRANTLWFISAMDEIGHRTNDYMVVGNIQGSVYVKDEKYTAQVWNPTSTDQTVTIKKADGTVVGTAKIGSLATVSFNITTGSSFDLKQAKTPTITTRALSSGEVRYNVSGTTTYEDTQLVELSSEDGATIYYTTDGTVPTTKSAKYTDRILVSSDTTIKAITVKDGYIDSAYGSAVIKINGDTVQSSDNIALSATTSASSDQGDNVSAGKANDGNGSTRWQAKANDDEYLQLDFGKTQTINTVKIIWEAAYAEKYEIQVSKDGKDWKTVAKESGKVGEVTSEFPATEARYVRMQGVSRGTAYGYSIYEMEVYGAVKAEAPVISPVSGAYDGKQTVTLSTSVKGAEIKYTLDGTTPTEDSATYTAPFQVSRSTVVKAVTYRKGMMLSDPAQSDIIINGTIALNKTEARLASNRTLQLSALTNEAVTWSSSNTKAATVNNNGLVTGKGVGVTTITVTTSSGKKATCIVTVVAPVHITSISIPETFEIRNKTSETLTLTINPSDTTDDTTATWESSDEHVLTVNENGTITAKGEGQAEVTVTVGKFTAKCQVTVGPAASNTEMAISKKYNVALGKTVTAYPSRQKGEGGSEKDITDGLFTGNHIATAFNTKNTAYELDLGDTYDASTLDRIVVKYKESNPGDAPFKGYEIQYSTNGIDYTTVKTVSGSDVQSACENNDCIDEQNMSGQTGAVRFIKFVYPDAYTWGVQVREIAVLSTDQNATTVEVKTCDDPAEFTVTSNKHSKIEYNIVAGTDQTDYKYAVYLDGNKVTELIDQGTGTIENVEKGTHTVKVVAFYNGLMSKGISKDVYVDDGSLVDYVNTVRNLSKGAKVTIDTIESKHEEGSKDPNVLTDGEISKDTAKCIETVWGSKTATITIELTDNVNKNQISEVLLAFKGDNTNATAYNIELSEDGTNYEKVIDKTGVTYKQAIEDKFNPSSYSKDTVKYVRVNLTNGNTNWGYQISEVALMGTEEFMPNEAQGLVVTSPEEGSINVVFTQDAGQLYNIYVDDAIKSMNVKAGNFTYKGINDGEHTVKVTAIKNGIESKGVTAIVNVEAVKTTAPTTTKKPETTTPKVTTTPQITTTPKATTKEPESTDVTTKQPGTTETKNEVETTVLSTTEETTKAADETSETTNNGTIIIVDPTKPTTTKKVVVKKTVVKKAIKKKTIKKVRLTLKKVKGKVSYQVKISVNRKFKNKKKFTVTKTFKKAKFNMTIKKLKKSKKYYVKARVVQVIGKKKYYSGWTKPKKIRIKK